ncbi:hypothetical protein [Pedobacter sp. P26]|uniref:hypothetical protein n=1 Tax=Pedobacter sp. P26 TaxID=3423956 RepID=UPI003D6641C4
MKKLSLKPNAFDKGEVLTRSQLRKVMGEMIMDQEAEQGDTINAVTTKPAIHAESQAGCLVELQ